MRVTLSLILLVVALVCFVLAAIGVGAGRINLVAAGLAAWVLSLIVG